MEIKLKKAFIKENEDQMKDEPWNIETNWKYGGDEVIDLRKYTKDTGLSGSKKQRQPEFEIDQGDCTWEVYPDWVICSSYPGNTAIYERRKNPNPATRERIKDGISNADPEDIENIITAALILKSDLYSKKDTIKSLFRLRKALEGIWGHDLPKPEVGE